ncbi:hypothetical protein [Methylobacterium oxalidis]|uniref:hypothetical protein n=1 Tax=Methylobacterium oxalidis TaxID=944322 RepID=UPI0033149180
MTDARHLLFLAAHCRHAAAALLLRAYQIDRASTIAPSIEAADLAATAMHLEEAAQELSRAAIHARAADAALLAEVRTHLAAGGDVVLVGAPLPASIVVGEPEDAATTPVVEPVRPRSWWARLNLFQRAA